MRRSVYALVLALLALGATACKDQAADTTPGAATSRSARPTATAGYPSSMAALGDSITAGFLTCLIPTPCPRNSWSTGDGTKVNSHYRRILAANPAMRGHEHNFAVAKALAADLPGQATAAVKANVEYVTILIGANDVCHGGIGDMTSVADFRAKVDEALGTLTRQLPHARVLVASVPDVFHLWEIGHDHANTARIWRIGNICPSLLANPTSTADADVQRRKTVADRIDAYDEQLAAACKASGHRCRYDGGAVHRTRFDIGMVDGI